MSVLSTLLGSLSGCSDKAAGCSKDSDCKGDRVCNSGACKEDADQDAEPKKKAPTGTAPAKEPSTNAAVPLPPLQPSPAPAPPSPPTGLPKVSLASCKDTEGRWATYTPMVEHVVAAARILPQTGCLRGDEIAGALSQCGGERRHGLVTVDVTMANLTTCIISVHTLELGERRWINLSVFVGINARFHSESYIVEMKPAGPSKYFFGFTGASSLCSGTTDPDAAGSDTSPIMRSEWGTLGANVRTDFFCADGSNLSAPAP